MKQLIDFNHAWSRPFLPAGEAGSVYLLIEAACAEAEEGEERAPVNLSLVFDTSDAMDGRLLEGAKEICRMAADRMGEDDILSLVAFGKEARTVFPPFKVAGKDLIRKRIESIKPDGATRPNLTEGLLEGARHVRKGIGEKTVNHVILLAGGQAPAFTAADRETLLAMASEFRSSGVRMTMMAAGDGLDEDLLEGIADYGGGNYLHVQKPEDLPPVFEQELERLLSVLAPHLTLTLSPSEHTEIAAVYGGRSDKQARQFVISSGGLARRQPFSVLVELRFQPLPEGNHPLLQLNWEYDGVSENSSYQYCSIEAAAAFTSNPALLDKPGDRNAMMRAESLHRLRNGLIKGKF